jgi:transcriptional regulator with XRE-family HTH domain
MANISKNIKRLRKQNNLTQDALAEKLFVTRQTVSYWETGRNQPTLDMLGDLATALNCSPLDIISTKKQKMTPTQDFILFQLMQIVKNKLLYIIL